MNLTTILDMHYKEYEFLILENANFDYVAASIDVFLQKDEWLLIFQVIGIDQDGPQTDVYYYSTQSDISFGIVALDTIQFETEEALSKEQLFNGKITILEKTYEYHFVPEQYQTYDLAIDDPLEYETSLLRLIKEELRPTFFLNANELLETFNLDPRWIPFYKAENWQHTEVEGLPPSKNIFFSSLERAIEHRDANLIEVGKSNIHWKNWCEYDFSQQENWGIDEEE